MLVLKLGPSRLTCQNDEDAFDTLPVLCDATPNRISAFDAWIIEKLQRNYITYAL